jgi:hypothetical protein
LVDAARVQKENHLTAASHWQTLSQNLLSSKPRLGGIPTNNFSIGSCKSNYHTVKAMTAPWKK